MEISDTTRPTQKTSLGWWAGLTCMLLPLLFFGINRMHDWGDDFAQYVDQTQDFLKGDTDGPVEVVNFENFSPPVKGSGFSLLLALPQLFFGTAIAPQLLLVSFCLLGCGLALFIFYQEKPFPFPPALSLLLVLVMAYNYHTLRLKMEIMPEFPFMLVLYACFLLLQAKGKWAFPALLLLTGLLISIRNMGWIFYGVVLLPMVWEVNSIKPITWKKPLAFFALPPLVHVSIKWIVFGHIQMSEVTWYGDVFSYDAVLGNFTENLKYYYTAFTWFFEQEVWWWANGAIKYSVLLLFVSGVFLKYKKGIRITDTFFLLYLLVLACYPYNKTGMRFLLPVMPIALGYIGTALMKISEGIPKGKTLVTVTFLAVILLSNFKNVKEIITSSGYVPGPQTEEAMEAFKAIREMVPPDQTVAFSRPWTLHLYTGRPAWCLDIYHPVETQEKEFHNAGVQYFLVSKDPGLEETYGIGLEGGFLGRGYKVLWGNQSFGLFGVVSPGT